MDWTLIFAGAAASLVSVAALLALAAVSRPERDRPLSRQAPPLRRPRRPF